MLREVKIHLITQRVRGGTYEISAAKLADAMLRRFARDADMSARDLKRFLAAEDGEQ